MLTNVKGAHFIAMLKQQHVKMYLELICVSANQGSLNRIERLVEVVVINGFN